MANLALNDLGVDQELDNAAASELRGGINFGFLGGLNPGIDPSVPVVPSFTQNVFVDYDQTLIQVAPVNFNNVADNGSVASIGGPVNITNVVGQSSINALSGIAGGAV